MQDSPAPLRLLFIGNSYTNRNDLPGLLTALAAAADPPRELVTRTVIENGASLRRHWNAGAAAGLLREERWDLVVLQEQSTLPLKNRGRYHENVRLFNDLARQQGARVVLYLTWARQAAPETQAAYNEAVAAIAREIDAVIAPVGIAWEHVLRTNAGPRLFEPDGSHPTPAGSYLAACVFFATLFGRSPEGLPVPKGFPLDPDGAALLQQAAWSAARSG